MTTLERNALAIFGDKKPHSYGEFVFFNFNLHRYKLKESDELLRKMHERGWVKRLMNNPDTCMDDFQLTDQGDLALREEQIRRGGDYRWYHYFDRSPSGAKKWGNDKNVFEFDARRDKLNLNRREDRKIFDILRRQKEKYSRLFG